MLESHSVLVFTEQEDYVRCRIAAEQLPGGPEKNRWLDLFLLIETHMTHRPPRPLAQLRQLSGVVDWHGRAALLLVTPEHFEQIAGSASQHRRLIDGATGIEVANADVIHLTETLGRLREKAYTVVRNPDYPDAPTTRQELWAQWLAPLVRAHRRVTIFDTYAGKNALSQHAYFGFEARHSEELAELPWLLSRLALDAPRAADGSAILDVTILTAGGGRLRSVVGPPIADTRTGKSRPTTVPATEARIVKAFDEMVAFLSAGGFPVFGTGRGIRSLKIAVFRDDARAHARHIHFTNSTETRPAYHRYLRFEGGFDAIRHDDLTQEHDGQMHGDWALSYHVAPEAAQTIRARLDADPSRVHAAPRDERELLARAAVSQITLDPTVLLSRNAR